MQEMLQQTTAQLTALLGPQVVRILGALVILVAGWLIALFFCGHHQGSAQTHYFGQSTCRVDSG